MEQSQQQQRVCPKDCRKCNMAQQIFCATSLTFNSYEVMSKLWERMGDIERKIDAIQSSESEFLSPVTHENDADGAITHQDDKTLLEIK